MAKTYRKLFTQQQLRHLLGEHVLHAHRVPADGRTYDISIMVVPGTEKPDDFSMRVEVTEKPRGTTCGE